MWLQSWFCFEQRFGPGNLQRSPSNLNSSVTPYTRSGGEEPLYKYCFALVVGGLQIWCQHCGSKSSLYVPEHFYLTLKNSIIEWIFSGSSSLWCSLCFCPPWSTWRLYCQGSRTENGKLARPVSWESSNFHSGIVVLWLKRALCHCYALLTFPNIPCSLLFIF